VTAYCDQTDCERAAGGSDKLIALADHDGDGSIDSTVLAASINDAERWIDSFLQRRYTVPLGEPSDIIRRVCADEAVYILKDYRDAVDDRAQQRHDENREWLESIVLGRVNPGIDPSPAKSTAVTAKAGNRTAVTDTDGDSTIVTRETLKGYW